MEGRGDVVTPGGGGQMTAMNGLVPWRLGRLGAYLALIWALPGHQSTAYAHLLGASYGPVRGQLGAS